MRRTKLITIALAAAFLASGSVPAERAAGRGLPDEYDIIRSDCSPFVIYHTDRYVRLAGEIEKLACRSIDAIAAGTGLGLIDSFSIFIAPGRESFDYLHGLLLPEWGEAFSDAGRMMIGINAQGVLRSPRPLDVVVRHEISHIFLSQRIEGARCPTWFVEGVAMRQSREWTLADSWNLAGSVWNGRVPDLEDLSGPFPKPADQASIAYRVSYCAVDELLGERPEDLITLTAFVRDLRDFDRAFILTFGESTGEYATRFHLSLEKKYRTAGFFVHSSPFWLFVVFLFLTAYLVKRIRNYRKVREWEAKEDEMRGERV